MKKNIFKLLFSAFLATSFVSCQLDNYEAPNAQLEGSILDIETGELVGTDIVNGTTIKLLEHGYDPVTPQYLIVRNEGTYANTMLFANTYTVQPDVRNFVQIDAQDVEIGKHTKLDFHVLPYIRVKNADIRLDGNKVTADFDIEQTTSDQVKKVALFAFKEPTVGDALNGALQEMPLDRIVGMDEHFRLSLNLGKNTSYFKEGKSYFFRVGALSNASGAKYNYAPAVRLELGEIVPDLEPEGKYFDRCESISGWSGGDFTLDGNDPQEGAYAIKCHTEENGFQFVKWPKAFDTEVTREKGVLQFDFFISDMSVYDTNYAGQIEITSGGNPDVEELHWNFFGDLRLHNGWNRIVLKLSEAEAVGGEIDLSAITFFRIYHLKSSGPSDVMIDNIKFYNAE